jgi:hypothetical protein
MSRLGGTLTFERVKVKERLQTVHESPDAKISYHETGERVGMVKFQVETELLARWSRKTC